MVCIMVLGSIECIVILGNIKGILFIPASVSCSAPDTKEHCRSPRPDKTGVPFGIPNQSLHNVPACEPDLTTTGSKCTGKLASRNL